MLRVKNDNLNNLLNKLKDGFFVSLFNNQIRIKHDLKKDRPIIVNKHDEFLSDDVYLIKELLLRIN
jgi:hypothetical protein